jgi:DUF1009 family protein
LRGIVAEAGKVLLLDRAQVAAAADRHKISLFGVSA